jgi:transposase
MARAIGYCTKNWTELTRFLNDAKIPPDNNASEAALRVVALGRKNFLFVGHEEAGENIAGLYSLVATCEANGVNPYDYLRDVLLRVSTHRNVSPCPVLT